MSADRREEAVRALRQYHPRGWSDLRIAAHCGLSRTTVSRWRRWLGWSPHPNRSGPRNVRQRWANCRVATLQNGWPPCGALVAYLVAIEAGYRTARDVAAYLNRNRTVTARQLTACVKRNWLVRTRVCREYQYALAPAALARRRHWYALAGTTPD